MHCNRLTQSCQTLITVLSFCRRISHCLSPATNLQASCASGSSSFLSYQKDRDFPHGFRTDSSSLLYLFLFTFFSSVSLVDLIRSSSGGNQDIDRQHKESVEKVRFWYGFFDSTCTLVCCHISLFRLQLHVFNI